MLSLNPKFREKEPSKFNSACQKKKPLSMWNSTHVPPLNSPVIGIGDRSNIQGHLTPLYLLEHYHLKINLLQHPNRTAVTICEISWSVPDKTLESYSNVKTQPKKVTKFQNCLIKRGDNEPWTQLPFKVPPGQFCSLNGYLMQGSEKSLLPTWEEHLNAGCDCADPYISAYQGNNVFLHKMRDTAPSVQCSLSRLSHFIFDVRFKWISPFLSELSE